MSSLLSWVQPAWAAADSAKIQNVQYDAARQVLVLTGQRNAQFTPDNTVFRLTEPDRLIIDIPNAMLATSVRVVPIGQDGLDRVELSQTLGTFYQVARLTVYLSPGSRVSSLKLESKANTLLASAVQSAQQVYRPMSPTPVKPSNTATVGTATILNTPALAQLTVIESARFDSAGVKIMAKDGKPLAVKNQFTLSAPNRLVVDFEKSVLASKDLTIPMDIKGYGPIRTIRLGQFDEETVRVVIEAPKPTALYVVYPGKDKSLIAISDALNSSLRTLPLFDQHLGTLENIQVQKRGGNTIIQVTSTQPMVRKVSRNANQIQLDLVNVAANPSIVNFDKQAFDEIQDIRLSPLSANEPNSKVLITLTDPRNTDMEQHLSLDGKTLEISLQTRPDYNAGARQTQLILPGESAAWADTTLHKPGEYTVVVDAGHGGKDMGANRNGVLEKDLNLSVALKLKQALEAKGIRVEMTRSTDVFLPLAQICAITNRIRPDAFVSVHTNASVNPSVTGLETYYYKSQSLPLAKSVHRRAVNLINSPDHGVRRAMFYVIHHTDVPAILFEMGYISNSIEREDLQSDARQRATAEAIAQGVVEFLGSR